MRQEQTASARSEDFEPLLPIDIISPPQQRGGIDHPDIPTPQEPKEMVEAEIEEKNSPGYKGDVNAPIDAPHPLANPPEDEPEPL